jgi:hypothetical protein
MFNFFNSRRVFKGAKGQITLPALLLIPTIMLIIALLLETTKLSREKMRHQFALDASAFTELTATSNFLNNIAYSNGAYPFRLFSEYFEYGNTDPGIELDTEKCGDKCDGLPPKIDIYTFFFRGGAFPAPPNPDGVIKPEEPEWEFHYSESSDTPDRANWETENPSVDSSKYYPINSKLIGEYYKVPWEVEMPLIYIMVYHMLGKIYEGQRKVYDEVSNEGEFFRKAYYLNSCREGENCSLSQVGREGSKEFKKYIVGTTPLYINNILVYLRDNDDQVLHSIELNSEKDLSTIGGKLYQFAFMNPGSRERMRQLFTGIDISQPFAAPDNYFGINLAQYKPHTHVRVALQCTKESNNCLWPNPTPKYQVRTYP